MDEGTDARAILNGSIYKLKLGYFGVKCRSQKQINDGLTIQEAIQNEAIYFSRHENYSRMAHEMGIPHLQRSLNRILMAHI
jgi:dynamin 1-like protein